MSHECKIVRDGKVIATIDCHTKDGIKITPTKEGRKECKGFCCIE